MVICLLFLLLQSWKQTPSFSFERKERLSEYQFFEGHLAQLTPAPQVIPYDLNTSLFSNYAEKLRFVKLPAGIPAVYNDSVHFEFPVGTIFIKNFYFPNDVRKPEKGRRILETRLLVKEDHGWSAFPYVWNKEQTEAYYDPAPEMQDVHYTDGSGKKVSLKYVIPNKNQCKGCHVRDLKIVPIGPAARHLNKDFVYPEGTMNQLAYWEQQGMLRGVPVDKASVPKLPVWNNPASGALSERARAYLDINCGHCHNASGPAGTSGLFLDIHEKNMNRLGVNKSPVAAGRGAGDLKYDIAPGEPQNSILIYRMKTVDPAIAMPEIGREQIHKEGVALIEEWISKLPVN